LEPLVTYRQIVTDLGLAILLAAPTLTLSRPVADPPAASADAGRALYQALVTPEPGERPRLG
jgi:hypothetical protein